MSNDSTKGPSNSVWITTARDGAIGANIFLKDVGQGIQKLSFNFSRSYLQKNGNTGYSNDLLSYNWSAVAKTGKEASEFCKKYENDPEGALAEGKRLNEEKKERARDKQEATPNGVSTEPMENVSL